MNESQRDRPTGGEPEPRPRPKLQPLGSPLDAEVEAFRREQRANHPGDLPGQERMFDGGGR